MNHSGQQYLKVKIKSLAAEATIIRHQELKWKQKARSARERQMASRYVDDHMDTFWGLRHHRKAIVGVEARASFIAYAYMRGQVYQNVENHLQPHNFGTAILHSKNTTSKSVYFQTQQWGTSLEVIIARAARIVQKYENQATEREYDVVLADMLDWVHAHPIFTDQDIHYSRQVLTGDKIRENLKKVAA